MGHMCGHFNKQIAMARGANVAGFFDEKNWRTFLQSGLALYSQALPAHVKEACCDLSFLGGDGTPIGLPADGWAAVKQVWEPAVDTPEDTVRRSRVDRCGITGGEGESNPVEMCRRFVLEITDREADVGALRNGLAAHQETMPSALYDELTCFLDMPQTDEDYEPLRSLIRCFVSRHSVTGVIPIDVAVLIGDREAELQTNDSAQFQQSWLDIGLGLWDCQMGPEITRAVEYQVSNSATGLPRRSTIMLILLIGELLMSTLFFWLFFQTILPALVAPKIPPTLDVFPVSFVIFFLSSALRVRQVREGIPVDDTVRTEEQEPPEAQLREDPQQTLFRYTLSPAGGDVRSSWGLSREGWAHVEKSADGCSKNRPRAWGHKARTATYFTFCELLEKNNCEKLFWQPIA